MANLIKSQILKHLSRFAKNLSSDQINLSALKGEGELRNLELNEQVLTDLLELPSWLRLTCATCDRVAVRIQWTKLKSVPIHLSLDEVRVEVETCEELRPPSSSTAKSSKNALASGGQYGFADKVVDGVTVTVNSVILTLKSRVFTASFQMSRIVVESKSPAWAKVDLRMTRIKNADKSETINFKELSWQTLRIEAKSTTNEDLTPLRLITNQARCRITIKKRIADCAVLGCRLVVILDDLLWVLTDDQLKAALHFADSLTGLLKRATEQTQKVKGARKLQSLAKSTSKDSSSKKKKDPQSLLPASRVFARYDVVETSYHFYSDRIDLHLCDDPGGRGRSCHPALSEGGAFQVSLSQLQVDLYPYHLAMGNRSAWIRYHEGVHATWLNNSLSGFQTQLLDAMLGQGQKNSHSPLTRANVAGAAASPNQSPLPANGDPHSSGVRETILAQLKKLLTANLVVRLGNFTLWKVSTSKEKKEVKEFVSAIDKVPLRGKARKKSAGEREKFSLPDDMPVVHFEYTQFYYPGDLDFPLPPPKLFAYINPVQVNLDPVTVLWLNAFALNLEKSVKAMALEKGEPPYLDVKIEAIMFKILLDASEEHPLQRDRPRSLHIQVSRLMAANHRSRETGTRADLAGCLDLCQRSDLFFGTDFPNRDGDLPTVCDKLLRHATGTDDVGPAPGAKKSGSLQDAGTDLWKSMRKDLLWTEAKDVWHVFLDPVWADFHGTPATDNRAVPLVDAFPVSLWLFKEPEDEEEDVGRRNKDEGVNSKPQAKLCLLATTSGLISAQINHFQLLFLLRAVEAVSEIATFLAEDVRHILGEERATAENSGEGDSVAIGVVAPQVDLSLLMPCHLGTNNESSTGPAFNTATDRAASRGSSACDLAAMANSSGDANISSTLANLAIASASSSVAASQSEAGSRSFLNTIGGSGGGDASLVGGESLPTSPQKRAPSPSQLAASLPPTSSTVSLASSRGAIPSINLPEAASSASLASTPSSKGRSHPHPVDQAKKHSLTTSLSNMMASLDNSLRQPGSGSRSPLEEDSVSIRSDGSSDSSESYVMLARSEAAGMVLPASSLTAKESIDNALFNIQTGESAPPPREPSPALEYALEVTEDMKDDSDDGSAEGGRTTPRNSLAAAAAGASERPASIHEPETIVKKERTFSVLTAHLGRFELAQQSVDGRAAIKLQAASLSCEECPAITWEEFQTKFSARSRGWSESTLNQPPSAWAAKIRFSNKAPDVRELLAAHHRQVTEGIGPAMSLRERISRSAEALLELRAQNLPLQFYFSTLEGLGHLVEDEVIPAPLPMKINLENITLHLVEDRPSPNVTSPGSLPVDLSIPLLAITRDRSGLFCLQPTSTTIDEASTVSSSVSSSTSNALLTRHLDLVRSSAASAETELQQRAALLTADNAGLRQQLETAAGEIQSLRRRLQEAEAARARSSRSQQALADAERENQSLRQTLKYLQGELVKAGKKS